MPTYIIRCTKIWAMTIQAPTEEAANLAVTTDEMCDRPHAGFSWTYEKVSSEAHHPDKRITPREYWILDAGGDAAALVMETRILAETATGDLPLEGLARRRGEFVTNPESDYWLWLLSKINGRSPKWLEDAKRGVA